MITLEELFYDLVCYNKNDRYLLPVEPRRLYADDIRPEDLPKKDWPEPPPNKRVIIIDI